MTKQTVTYKDYNGQDQTQDLYFHLSKPDLLKLNAAYAKRGGFQVYVEKIVNANDEEAMYEVYEDLIKRSYGVKSEDGSRFVKDKETTMDFMSSAAYEEFFVNLASTDDVAMSFIKGIMP